MSSFKNLSGMKFGKLTVLYYFDKNKSGNSRWVCSCECGNKTKPIVGSLLINGRTKSCGCYEKENLLRLQKDLKKYNKFDIIGDIAKVYFYNNQSYFICDTKIFYRNDVKNICWLKNNRGYIVGRDSSGKNILFHRFILNPKKEEVVDHINGNTLDNRLINLRTTSQLKNIWNSKIGKNNKSGKTGVYFYNNKWIATISVNKKRIYLGSFNDIKDAIFKRISAENLYYGKNYISTLRVNEYEPISLDEIIR